VESGLSSRIVADASDCLVGMEVDYNMVKHEKAAHL